MKTCEEFQSFFSQLLDDDPEGKLDHVREHICFCKKCENLLTSQVSCQEAQNSFTELFNKDNLDRRLSLVKLHILFCPLCYTIVNNYVKENPDFKLFPSLSSEEEIAQKAEKRFLAMKEGDAICEEARKLIPLFVESPPNMDNREKILPYLHHFISCDTCRVEIKNRKNR